MALDNKLDRLGSLCGPLTGFANLSPDLVQVFTRVEGFDKFTQLVIQRGQPPLRRFWCIYCLTVKTVVPSNMYHDLSALFGLCRLSVVYSTLSAHVGDLPDGHIAVLQTCVPCPGV